MSTTTEEATKANDLAKAQPVRIVDVRVPLGSIFILALKVTLAVIPIALVLAFIAVAIRIIETS